MGRRGNNARLRRCSHGEASAAEFRAVGRVGRDARGAGLSAGPTIFIPIRSTTQQQLRHIVMPCITGCHQCRPTIWPYLPHVGTSIQQQLRHIAVPVQTGTHQGRPSTLRCLPHVGTSNQ